MLLNKINLDIDYDYFLNADYTQHSGSCLAHQSTEQKDLHDEYSNFNHPTSYNEHNTVLHQLWFDKDQIDYDDLGKKLGMEVVSVSSILQEPGQTILLHRDMFYQITKKYPDDKRLKVRANIYLHDWELGHIFQYRDTIKEWQNSTHWKQGEGFLWDCDIFHTSSNFGLKNKYTLQISGFLN